MILIWRRVLPLEAGITEAPTRSAVVETEPPGEQAVPERDLDHVVLRYPAHRKDPRREVAPDPDVVLRIPHNGRCTRRPGGSVDPDHLAERNREETIGVTLPKVLLRGEREAGEIGQGADVFRQDPESVELLPIEGDVGIDSVQRRLEPLELELLELFPVHALPLGLPEHLSTSFGHALSSELHPR